MSSGGVFLSAEWRDLALLNYVVEPTLLQPFVPPGTELDLWKGKAYLSLVAFRFVKTRVMGLVIPFHRDFLEVNLRLYVRRRAGGGFRRGVVFIREIVPRYAIALVARAAYGENYLAVPMSCRIEPDRVEYRWRHKGWTSLRLDASGSPAFAAEGSHEQFITEHYWGYSPRFEYEVRHDPWRLRPSSRASVEGDTAALYGPEFGRVLSGEPDSAFLAEGSPVTILRPRRLSAG